ncbi:MAG: hypothetical protein AB7O45_17900, partial [Alphaproteobacteria bacterium]
TAERRLTNGTLRHCGGPLMDWCVGNAKVEATPTAIRATKQNAGDAKVDPFFALLDAVTLMATNPAALGISVYEHPDANDEGPGADARDLLGDDFDWQALNDVAHPRFSEMKERFERYQDAREAVAWD